MGLRWSNVKLILAREIRDQMRDRRTMFLIVVLPILLYPLIGLSFLQFAQVAQERPTRVLVLGRSAAPEVPVALFGDDGFAADFAGKPEEAGHLRLRFAPLPADEEGTPIDERDDAWRAVRDGRYDAALYFPPEFAEKLESLSKAIQDCQGSREAGLPTVPVPEILWTSAKEKSQLAMRRLSDVLDRWKKAVGRANLQRAGLPPSAIEPFGKVEVVDVAGETEMRGAALWARILPAMLILWAMTGAFYPAIDLCAGEKERGTLETLLSSPARRSEIVLGKLLTVMLFSGITAVLNLVSIGLLGCLVIGEMPGFDPPAPSAIIWLAVALLPIVAFFGAVSLALAAFARSSREGQYYLMPLLFVTMPLVVIPTVSGMELNLGSSLVPVCGIVLLLRTALQGNYWGAAQYLLPVGMVTGGCCLIAIRWAIDQFNSESVLFRESERLDIALRLRRFFRDRPPTPALTAAAFCGVVILFLRFFLSFVVPIPDDFSSFMRAAILTQMVVIAAPAVVMTFTFASSPRGTLLLRRPARWAALPAAAVLAIALHPVAAWLQAIVMELYPLNEPMTQAIREIEQQMTIAPVWQVLLIVAVVPAICEELAFRGFILTGLMHVGRKWRAIIYASMFFALSHAILQQSMIALLLGVVIGLLAVHSRSLFPGMIFHVVHNGLAVVRAGVSDELLQRWPSLEYIFGRGAEGEPVFRWPVIVAGAVMAGLILFWFQRLPQWMPADRGGFPASIPAVAESASHFEELT